MELKAWKKRFDGAPVNMCELAETAKGISDCKALSGAAWRFLDASAAFEAELVAVGSQVG